MNMAYRGTPLPLLVAAQTFVSPEVPATEDIPAPEAHVMPKVISRYAQRIRDIIIIQLVVKMIRECINWISEHL